MMGHRTCIGLTGVFWLGMGFWLLHKGLRFAIIGSMQPERWFSFLGDSLQSGTLLVVIGLILGYLKGKYVLSKTALRVVHRIVALPAPLSLKSVYPLSYWIVICSMMALGMLLNVLSIPLDVRGVVDIGIGSALLNGSLFYFKHVLSRPA